MPIKSGNTANVYVSTYYVGVHFILCHGPIDSINQIFVDNKTPWTGHQEDGTITIDSKDLFRGFNGEGGIAGDVDICLGLPSQGQNDYLTSKLGGLVPNYRGVVSAVLNQVYIGLNYYLKPWAFLCSRIHTRKNGLPQWYDAYAEVPSDTTSTYTSGLTAKVLTITSFNSVATVTMNGNHGLSNGVIVTVSGATDSLYNGTFTISNCTLTTFTYEVMRDPFSNATGPISIRLGDVFGATGLINAVHVLRDCYTDTTWGLGYDESLLPDSVWQAAAKQCYIESLGFSWLWKTGTLEAFITDVCNHINANVYQSRLDGKIYINLLREITNPTGLVELNSTNSSAISGFHKRLTGDRVSSVIVNYEDNTTNLPATSPPATDIGLASRQRNPVTQTISYSGVATMDVAWKLAQRDLKQLSAPVYLGSITCNRVAEYLNKGDAFVLNRPDYYPTPLILRVVNINLGTLESGKITIDFMEDSYEATSPSIPNTLIAANTTSTTDSTGTIVTNITTTTENTSSGIITTIKTEVITTIGGVSTTATTITKKNSSWTDPISVPLDCTNRLLIEAPYYAIAIMKGEAFAQALDPLAGYFIMAAASPTPDALKANLWVDSGSGYTLSNAALHFCCYGIFDYGTLIEHPSLNKTETYLTFQLIFDEELLAIGDILQIGNELISVAGIYHTAAPPSTSISVKRGVLDTVPEIHPQGDFIFSWSNYYGTDSVSYLAGETVHVKATTITGKGELAVTEASANNLTFVGRAGLPYPPGNLKINGLYWPEALLETSSCEITWASRNRFQQTAGPIDYYSASVTSEPGVTYKYSLSFVSPDQYNDMVSSNVHTPGVLFSGSGLTSTSVTLDVPGFALPGVVVSIVFDSDGFGSDWGRVTMSAPHGLFTAYFGGSGGAITGAAACVYIRGLSPGNYTGWTVVTTFGFGDYEFLFPMGATGGTLPVTSSTYQIFEPYGNLELTVASTNANGDCLQPVKQAFKHYF